MRKVKVKPPKITNIQVLEDNILNPYKDLFDNFNMVEINQYLRSRYDIKTNRAIIPNILKETANNIISLDAILKNISMELFDFMDFLAQSDYANTKKYRYKLRKMVRSYYKHHDKTITKARR